MLFQTLSDIDPTTQQDSTISAFEFEVELDIEDIQANTFKTSINLHEICRHI